MVQQNFLKVAEDEYHAESGKSYLSSHLLGDVRNSGLDVLFNRPPREFVPAFRFGSLVHKLVLEGEAAFFDEYRVKGVTNPKTGKSYGGGTLVHQGMELLEDQVCATPEEWDQIRAMAHNVWSHETIKDVLESGAPELVGRAEMFGLSCQGRFDWINFHTLEIFDLKTCRTIDNAVQDAFKYGYLYQFAFYTRLFQAVAGTDEVPTFHCGFVEKQKPYRVLNIKVSSDQIKAHASENAELMLSIRDQLKERKECPVAKSLLAK